MINLSHVKFSNFSSLPNNDLSIINEINDKEEIENEIDKKESLSEMASNRIKPNSNFLRRYVGEIEKINEKISILSPSSSSSNEIFSNIKDNKIDVIQALKG